MRQVKSKQAADCQYSLFRTEMDPRDGSSFKTEKAEIIVCFTLSILSSIQVGT